MSLEIGDGALQLRESPLPETLPKEILNTSFSPLLIDNKPFFLQKDFKGLCKCYEGVPLRRRMQMHFRDGPCQRQVNVDSLKGLSVNADNSHMVHNIEVCGMKLGPNTKIVNQGDEIICATKVNDVNEQEDVSYKIFKLNLTGANKFELVEGSVQNVSKNEDFIVIDYKLIVNDY